MKQGSESIAVSFDIIEVVDLTRLQFESIVYYTASEWFLSLGFFGSEHAAESGCVWTRGANLQFTNFWAGYRHI